jgi:acyl dehydratase
VAESEIETSTDDLYGLNVGTYEEGLTHVGRPTEVRFSELPVNEAMVRQFVGAVHDPNPLYWDPALATRLCGSPVAPPATLVIWTTAQNWTPTKQPGPAPALLVKVPMPGDSMINISSEIEFFDHIRVGDRLNVVEEVEAISEEKQTKVGRGHFVTVVARFRRESGELVATQRNVLLRFWGKTVER